MEIIKKFTLEILRVAILAVIPVLILGLENGTVDFKLVLTVGAIAILRGVDKALHDTGIAQGGLTRF